MAKKKAVKRDHTTRIDLKQYGIDLTAILDEIRENLTGTKNEIADRAGNMTAGSVSNTLNGTAKPSLGSLAALAQASGGRLLVKYEPPKKSKR